MAQQAKPALEIHTLYIRVPGMDVCLHVSIPRPNHVYPGRRWMVTHVLGTVHLYEALNAVFASGSSYYRLKIAS